MAKLAFEKAVESTLNRMVAAAQQRVKFALKHGATVVDCGVYREGGPLFLIVEYNNEKIECQIPEDKADATYEWANKKMAQASRPYCRNAFYAA